MVKVKVCGITRLQDALAACECGVDALGFVFYASSPRNIQVKVAKEIIEALPPFVSSVGLFVNPNVADVHDILTQTKLDLLQFHGDENADFCRQFSRPYIKAIRMAPALELDKEIEKFPCARGILLDSYDPHLYGGTGHSFQWDRVHAGITKPIIIAGGLTPANVAQAVQQTRPWAVDVSGGVEQSKGVKQRDLIEAFVRGAKRGQ